MIGSPDSSPDTDIRDSLALEFALCLIENVHTVDTQGEKLGPWIARQSYFMADCMMEERGRKKDNA